MRDEQYPIQIYHEVLNKQRKMFPPNFWKEDQTAYATSNSVILTKYLIKKILRWKNKDIPKRISRQVFKKHGLRSMIDVCFKGSPILAVMNAFPNEFKPWEFTRTPQRFWKSEEGKEHAYEAIKWMIEEKMKIPIEQIPSNVNGSTFKQYGLLTMLHTCFNSSPYKAFSYVYPGKFTEFDFPAVPADYWRGEEGKKRAAIVTKELIENKLKIPIDEIPKRVNNFTFSRNGFEGMLSKGFNHSAYHAINNAYPNRFKPWEFKITPRRIWSGDNADENYRKAIKWLVEEKLGWDYQKAKQNLKQKHFIQHGLISVLQKKFRGNSTKALEFAYE